MTRVFARSYGRIQRLRMVEKPAADDEENVVDVPVVDYPKPWLLLWVAGGVAIVYCCLVFLYKWRGWARGMKLPPLRRTDLWRVAEIWLSEVLLQRQILSISFYRWLAHMLVFWGFLGLTMLSAATSLARNGALFGVMDPFSSGSGYALRKIWGNGFGLLLLLGLCLTLLRQFVPGSNTAEGRRETDRGLTIFLLWLTVSGFALESLRLSLVSQEGARYSFVSAMFAASGTRTVADIGRILTGLWVAHGLSGIALIVYVPHSKLVHSILAPIVIGLNAIQEQKREDLYWPHVARQKATRLRKT